MYKRSEAVPKWERYEYTVHSHKTLQVIFRNFKSKYKYMFM